MKLSSKLSGRQKYFVRNIPKEFRDLFIKIYEDRASESERIAGNCYSCVGFEHIEHGVKFCTIDICVFWSRRPYRKKGE